MIGHRRNKRKIMPWRGSWQTECRVCATRLARVRRGKWVPIGVVARNSSWLRTARARSAD
jgi:hypothetical protein